MRINNLIAGTYEHRSRDVSSRKLLNCMAEITPSGRTEAIIIGTPAQKMQVDMSLNYPGQGCRGVYWTSTSRLFAFFGGDLIEVFGDNTFITRFSTTYSPNPVSMTDDGLSLIFVDGSQMMRLNLETNVITSVAVDFDKPSKVLFANNRAICINNDESLGVDENTQTRRYNRIYWSELRDFNTWLPLSFSAAEQSADRIIGLAVRDNDVWIFGTTSYEIWRNGIDANQPFEYAGGNSANIGCSAPNSVSSLGDNIFWLGSSTSGVNHIYMSNGFAAEDITTTAISSFLSQNNALTQDAIGYCYTQEMHSFYCITFNQLDRTFVYDMSTKLWHERSTRDKLLNIHHKWRAQYATYAFGKVYVGDISNACIYTLEMDKYYDDIEGGATLPIVRIMQSPTISNEDLKEIFISYLTMDMETGNSLQIGQGSDAKLLIQSSKDGGYTWGAEVEVSMGKMGEYQTRPQWRRVGRAREWTFRFTLSDPVRFLILGVSLDATNSIGGQS